MNRTGLLIALGIAVATGTLFAVFPRLDVLLVAPFHEGGFGGWAAAQAPWARLVRQLISWTIGLIAGAAGAALVLKLLLPRRPMLIPGRAIILLLSTLAIAPGLVANVLFKDNWHRPRPFHLQEFGGPASFVPWWDPRGSCDTNCSFVAGEPSGAFWTLAPAAVTPPPVRAAAYGAALLFGAAVGLLRVAAGGHFFTDVVFAGVFTFLVIWIVYGLLYRRRSRLTDESIERLLERLAMPMHDAMARFAARIRGTAPRH